MGHCLHCADTEMRIGAIFKNFSQSHSWQVAEPGLKHQNVHLPNSKAHVISQLSWFPRAEAPCEIVLAFINKQLYIGPSKTSQTT